MMTDMGEMVVGHGMDIENLHTLVNIMLQGSDQLTEQEKIQIFSIVQNSLVALGDLCNVIILYTLIYRYMK